MERSLEGERAPFLNKSAERAMQFKTLGNAYFKSHDNHKALKCYAKAVLLAPYNTEDQQQFLTESLEILKQFPSKHKVAKSLYAAEIAAEVTNERDPLLSFCFGNRSAVLHEMERYDDCLLDIEQAWVLGFPPESLSKLKVRRKEAQQKRKLKSANHEASFSVFRSDAFSVLSSPESGRHMRASRDIHPGEVLLSEEPYAAVLDPQFLLTHCSYCFKESPYSLLPCILCPCESYCGPQCRQKAWVKYHWLECRLTCQWRKNAEWIEVLCLRIVLSANPSDILNVCIAKGGTEIASVAEYGVIYSLVTHEDNFSDKRQKTFLVQMADNLYRCFGEHILQYILPVSETSDSSRESTEVNYQSELKKLFLRHLLQLRCNSHSVSEVLGNSLEDEAKAVGNIEIVKEVRLGTVLLPTGSLINHSCSPNAIFRFIGNSVQVYITREVKRGDEINISYGPQIGRMKMAQRKKNLKEKYYFDCQCVACAGSDSTLILVEAAMDGLACLKCSTGALAEAPQSDGEVSYICCHCQTRLSGRELSKQIEAKKMAKMLFGKATKGIMDLELLLECQKIQTSILHRYNRDLARTNDSIACVCANQGNFELSVEYLKQSCYSVSVLFGEWSIEFANEIKKLASILFHSGRTKEALDTAEKAKAMISVYYGLHHTDHKELDEMVIVLKSLS